MTASEFQMVFPFVHGWIQRTLKFSAPDAIAVASLNLPRLPHFFSRALLERTRVVTVDAVPKPPLTAVGLDQFAEFEKMEAGAITYLNTYFIEKSVVQMESIHFHEIIHVIQWEALGAERFLALYAEGLEKHGYRNSPLEAMAYEHEERFKSSETPYAVAAVVRQQLQGMS